MLKTEELYLYGAEHLTEQEMGNGGAVYERALAFAAEAHKNQKRKSRNTPFILHPIETASIVKQMLLEEKKELLERDYELMAAALLHDVVEDTKYAAEDIRANFSEYITELVGHETENKRPETAPEESWKIRKTEFLESLKRAPRDAKMITMGDKLSNMRSLAEDYREQGDEVWNIFHNKEKAEHAWYYQGIAKELGCFERSKAYQEYCELLEEVFWE